QVLVERHAEDDVIGPPRVAVRALAAVGGDLDRVADDQHRHGAVRDPRRDGAAENALYLIGMRAGGDVPVLGRPSQQYIAHAAADDLRRMPGLDEPPPDLHRPPPAASPVPFPP